MGAARYCDCSDYLCGKLSSAKATPFKRQLNLSAHLWCFEPISNAVERLLIGLIHRFNNLGHTNIR